MSFKIICNKCKTETEIENEFEGIETETIRIYATMDGRVIIECAKCDNDIISK